MCVELPTCLVCLCRFVSLFGLQIMFDSLACDYLSALDVLVNARTAAWKTASVELFYNAALAQPMFKISAGRKQAGEGKIVESCVMAACSDQLPADPAHWAISPLKLIDMQLPVVEWERRSNTDVFVRVPNDSAARCEVVVGMSVLNGVLALAHGEELLAPVLAPLVRYKDSALRMLQAISGSGEDASPVCKVRFASDSVSCVFLCSFVCLDILECALSLRMVAHLPCVSVSFCIIVWIADNV